MGNCDHSTSRRSTRWPSPPAARRTAGVCSACTADSQCGAGDECVYMGSMGDSYCLQGCGKRLPDRLHVLGGDVYSVDGAQRQAVRPEKRFVPAPTGACADDTYEEDDYMQPGLGEPRRSTTETSIDCVSCPSRRADAKRMTTGTRSCSTADDARRTSRSRRRRDRPRPPPLSLGRHGGVGVDELHVRREHRDVPHGRDVLRQGQRLRPRAQRVPARRTTRRPRRATRPASTTPPRTTTRYSQARVDDVPDAHVDGAEDLPERRRLVQGPPLRRREADDGPDVHADRDAEDLDIHLFKDFTDLWPCSPSDPSTCTIAHGQGASSNEHAIYTVPAGLAPRAVTITSSCAAGTARRTRTGLTSRSSNADLRSSSASLALARLRERALRPDPGLEGLSITQGRARHDHPRHEARRQGRLVRRRRSGARRRCGS